MKIILRCFVYGLLCLSLTSNAEVSSSFSQDHKELIKFIQQLYAIPTTTYLFANFNNEFQPKKHCQLMARFIAKESLFKDAQGACFEPIRYPTMNGEDAFLSSDYPVPKIQIPVVNGSLAEVLVLFKKPDTGRVRYYLKKTQVGWRIYKSRSDERADVPENNTDPEIYITFTDFPPSAADRERANHPQ